MEKQPHANKCGAKTRSGGPCRNAAMANGRCRMHGGKSTGPPKKNKNALKTGEHETIWLDTLDEEERVLFDVIKTDVLVQIEETIRLMTIRERRMLQYRQRVLDGWQQNETEVMHERRKITDNEVPTFDEDGKMTYQSTPEYGMVEVQRTEKERDQLARILAIEEALTRVQDKKAKLLELKHKIQSAEDPEEEDDSLDSLKAAIEASKSLLVKAGVKDGV